MDVNDINASRWPPTDLYGERNPPPPPSPTDWYGERNPPPPPSPTDWYGARNDPRNDQRPELSAPTRYYGLSGRPDVPAPRPPPSPGLNFAVYDPVTRQRTTAVDRNCTAPGCCVPKCFAEKGSRVSDMFVIL